jgi:DNA (cytosine-5)-methyltransferase 1
MLTVGSLFSGIGGLDLGLERAGMKVIWQSEIDPYCNKVLKKHWPEVPNYGNIKEIEWATIPRPDVICGGYPCQPFSTAGKRLGTDDPRHLWPWVRTAISELQPRYAILENVRGHLSMGGLQVIGELAEIGYDAEWRVVSAAGVGAPHRRDRIIIVAYPNGCNSPHGGQRTDVPSQDKSGRDDGSGSASDFRQIGVGGSRKIASKLADSKSERSNGRQPRNDIAQRAKKGLQEQIRASGSNVADTDSVRPSAPWAKQQTAVFARSDSNNNKYLATGPWQVEPDVGRVANGVSARVDRLRGLGNAVVPQVAEYIGRLVMAAELNNS